MNSSETVTPERDWYVRPFRRGDEAGLLALSAVVSGRTRQLDELRWKLLGRQADFPTVFVAAPKRGSGILGQYAGIPLKLKNGQHIEQLLCAVDAMTHPDYRRQGILTALVKAAHVTWAAAGQAFVAGLPNEQWGARKHVLGYRELFPLAWLRFPLRLDRAASRRAGVLRIAGNALGGPLRATSAVWGATHVLRRAANYDLSPVSKSSAEEIDGVWSQVAPTWPYAVVRDADWATWRYLSVEPQPYTVLAARERGLSVGYIAYRLATGGARVNGHIADLVMPCGRDDVAASLVRHALDDLDRQGAALVMTLAPPRSPLYNALRRLGFLPARASTAFGVEFVSLQPTSRISTMRDPARWLLTGGDFDVI